MVRGGLPVAFTGTSLGSSLGDDAGIGQCLIQKDDSLVMCSALNGL